MEAMDEISDYTVGTPVNDANAPVFQEPTSKPMEISEDNQVQLEDCKNSPTIAAESKTQELTSVLENIKTTEREGNCYW